MRKFLSRFVGDESGVTAIEYGLIAAGIAVALVAVTTSLGPAIQGTFEDVAGQMSGN